MLYIIIGEDRPGSLEARLAARPAHLERLTQLQQEARLILAGPCPTIDSPDPEGPADQSDGTSPAAGSAAPGAAAGSAPQPSDDDPAGGTPADKP